MNDIIQDLEWLAVAVKAEGGGEWREFHVVIAAIAEIKRLREENSK